MNKVRRLYDQFHPQDYQLTIKPNKEKMSFQGKTVIHGFKVGRPSKRLTFHAKDLKISEVEIIRKEKKESKKLNITRIVYHKSYDELRLHCQEMIYPGEYTISLNFKGKINKQMNGLYPCFYQVKDQEHIILATQFESHHAREVFPCIDEPEAKAIFNLTLITWPHEVVLANSQVKEIKQNENQVTTIFEPTLKMSTYLLAFVIGDLGFIEKKTIDGVKVRVYTTQQNVAYSDFALDTAVNCLQLYNQYFGIDYPLKKCDLVALPDFASGAMENWGLITFREQALIVDPLNTSLSMKQYVANVIAHELTHQWFGNLVTMRWWNDLWLNESFATLMSYLAIDKLFPEWKVWNQFIVEEQSAALKLDSLANTHPVNVTINHPDEIRTIFDNISYEKGASVLYMLMCYLGAEKFKQGLNLYLLKHSYANSESSDLWDAWEAVSDMPIREFMESWTKQPGYPILTVDVQKSKVLITQERFYLNDNQEEQGFIWPIPLFTQDIDKKYNILTKNECAINIDLSSINQLIINRNHTAFCRTIYNNEHITILKELIDKNQLTELDRQGLLEDSFEAAKAGYLPTTQCFNLLQAYYHEDSEIVWNIISSNLASVRAVMDNEDLRIALNKKIVDLIDLQYQRLGWDGQASENHFDRLLRPIILGLACSSESQQAILEAKKRFNQRASQPIDPDIRGVVYTTVARQGGNKEYQSLLKMYQQTNNSEEKVILAAALTNFKQKKMINQTLRMITQEDVRLQDVAYWVSYSFANRHAKELTWEWLQDNWQWLIDNLGNDLSFYMMPRYAARLYSDENFIPIFRDFFQKHMTDSLNRPVNQAIETITWQAKWKQRDLNNLKKYFNKD